MTKLQRTTTLKVVQCSILCLLWGVVCRGNSSVRRIFISIRSCCRQPVYFPVDWSAMWFNTLWKLLSSVLEGNVWTYMFTSCHLISCCPTLLDRFYGNMLLSPDTRHYMFAIGNYCFLLDEVSLGKIQYWTQLIFCSGGYGCVQS
jgi:hypothetical protein